MEGADTLMQDSESTKLAVGGSQLTLAPENAAHETSLESAGSESSDEVTEDTQVGWMVQENTSHLQHHGLDHQAHTTNLDLDDKDRDSVEGKETKKISEGAVAGTNESLSCKKALLFDTQHLAGTTKSEFEAEQNGEQREKTAQEKTEEQIVIEYIKKQSLLEVYHHNNGKSRATAMEDEDDEDLQKALTLSMQEYANDGTASGA